MIDDERGQWILMMGLMVSIGMIALVLLLNQAMMTGHQSSQAILNFPKHEIRELVEETDREMKIVAYEAWNLSGRPYVTGISANDTQNRTAIWSNFTIMASNYTNSTRHIYAYHGQIVNISMINVTFYNELGKPNNISSVGVGIIFDDGITIYENDPKIIEC
ncbi:MAG: hypothetical protein SVM80_03770 [Halobacteriota archaeon]|nr:hypothetical protein [Halobacteriota archaeon]